MTFEIRDDGEMIIPDEVWRELDEKLDAEIAKHPDAAPWRAELRQELVLRMMTTGELPPIELELNPNLEGHPNG